MNTKYIDGKHKAIFTGVYGTLNYIIGFRLKNNTNHGFSLGDDGIVYFTNDNLNIKLDTIEMRRQKLKTFIDKCS